MNSTPIATLACIAFPASLVIAGCASADKQPPGKPPIAGATAVDELIQPGEKHFAHLWRITSGGENAEGYFSFAGDRLTLQRTGADGGCDRIFVTDPATGALRQISPGRGVTTCSFFLPGDKAVLFASTQAHMRECPPPPDHSQGYTWRLFAEYDLWVHNLETGEERQLTDSWGYDAEGTVSPRGDRIVFTSTRSGDSELWSCNLDGSDLRQLTREIGYDGGGFFSHDGSQVVFRSTVFTPGKEDEERATYRELLAQGKVRPHSLELMLVSADGSKRRQLTHLGGANFAPFFFPGDRRVIFSSDHHALKDLNFDLFAVDTDGGNLERITTFSGFDSFPQFSPNGRFLVFASNRGGSRAGETNLYIAEWR